jgi:hypothetical protein
MKILSLLVFLAVYALSGKAQDQIVTDYQSKNLIKFLPFTLPFNSVSFEYERLINPKNSVVLQVGIPNQQSIMGKYGINPNSDLKTAVFGSTIIRGGYRHYTGKSRLPKGFYLEPYLKYQHFKGDASIAGVDDQGDPYSGNSEIKLNTVNLGCQMGVQFLIAKRVSLDLYFLGLEGGLLSGKIVTTPTTNSEYNPIILSVLKNVIDQNIADAPAMIRNKLSTTQTASQVIVNLSSTPYPWIRGGISLGFAF